MSNFKKPSETLTTIKNVMIGILIILGAAFFTGAIVMYGRVETLDERTKDFPSVTGLIVTQDALQGKVDAVTFDSFMVVFCTYIKAQDFKSKKQDSINGLLLKMMKERGVRDSLIQRTKAWIHEGNRICKHC
jgi:hypothetical protein